MARADNLVSRVRVAFTDVPDVTEKKMFGSTAFIVRGKMCVTARRERIMCRIDPALHDTAIKCKGCQTMVMKGRKYQGYVYIAADAVRTKAALKYWVELALNYNETIGTLGKPESDK